MEHSMISLLLFSLYDQFFIILILFILGCVMLNVIVYCVLPVYQEIEIWIVVETHSIDGHVLGFVILTS